MEFQFKWENLIFYRLTPVYAIILGFIATLMVYIGTGPNWYNVIVASEGCRITWWRQFLYSESSSFNLKKKKKLTFKFSMAVNNLFPTDTNVQV